MLAAPVESALMAGMSATDKYRDLCIQMLDWMRDEGHQRAFDDFGQQFEEVKSQEEPFDSCDKAELYVS